MKKILVAVFNNEAKAYEGLNSLEFLRLSGYISLYSSALVSNDTDGKLLLKSSLGVSISAAPSRIIGLILDTDSSHINIRFVDELIKLLTKDKTAVIAELEEETTLPVDKSLEPLNVTMFRRLRYEVVNQ